jgi:hypothetical protein
MVEKARTAHLAFYGRPQLGRGFFAVRDRQVAWAGRRGVRIDRQCRVATPDLNLYAPLRPETRAALEAGDGSELKNKFLKLYSSSALAVNVFAYWHDKHDLLEACFGLSGPFHLRFESKHPIFDDPKAKPPNIDVELNGSNGNLILECKFTEPFVRYPKKYPLFSSTYFRPENASVWRGMESTRSFAEHINYGEHRFTRLDAEQLIRNGPNEYGTTHAHSKAPALGPLQSVLNWSMVGNILTTTPAAVTFQVAPDRWPIHQKSSRSAARIESHHVQKSAPP